MGDGLRRLVDNSVAAPISALIGSAVGAMAAARVSAANPLERFKTQQVDLFANRIKALGACINEAKTFLANDGRYAEAAEDNDKRELIARHICRIALASGDDGHVVDGFATREDEAWRLQDDAPPDDVSIAAVDQDQATNSGAITYRVRNLRAMSIADLEARLERTITRASDFGAMQSAAGILRIRQLSNEVLAAAGIFVRAFYFIVHAIWRDTIFMENVLKSVDFGAKAARAMVVFNDFGSGVVDGDAPIDLRKLGEEFARSTKLSSGVASAPLSQQTETSTAKALKFASSLRPPSKFANDADSAVQILLPPMSSAIANDCKIPPDGNERAAWDEFLRKISQNTGGCEANFHLCMSDATADYAMRLCMDAAGNMAPYVIRDDDSADVKKRKGQIIVGFASLLGSCANLRSGEELSPSLLRSMDALIRSFGTMVVKYRGEDKALGTLLKDYVISPSQLVEQRGAWSQDSCDGKLSSDEIAFVARTTAKDGAKFSGAAIKHFSGYKFAQHASEMKYCADDFFANLGTYAGDPKAIEVFYRIANGKKWKLAKFRDRILEAITAHISTMATPDAKGRDMAIAQLSAMLRVSRNLTKKPGDNGLLREISGRLDGPIAALLSSKTSFSNAELMLFCEYVACKTKCAEPVADEVAAFALYITVDPNYGFGTIHNGGGKSATLCSAIESTDGGEDVVRAMGATAKTCAEKSAAMDSLDAYLDRLSGGLKFDPINRALVSGSGVPVSAKKSSASQFLKDLWFINAHTGEINSRNGRLAITPNELVVDGCVHVDVKTGDATRFRDGIQLEYVRHNGPRKQSWPDGYDRQLDMFVNSGGIATFRSVADGALYFYDKSDVSHELFCMKK
ncbi:MAG: hypothetical protein LBB38_00455, partial [Puniceicoccales bacterium]|nr:hypothetical protein [Puniceicoccales bacterium]